MPATRPAGGPDRQRKRGCYGVPGIVALVLLLPTVAGLVVPSGPSIDGGLPGGDDAAWDRVSMPPLAVAGEAWDFRTNAALGLGVEPPQHVLTPEGPAWASLRAVAESGAGGGLDAWAVASQASSWVGPQSAARSSRLELAREVIRTHDANPDNPQDPFRTARLVLDGAASVIGDGAEPWRTPLSAQAARVNAAEQLLPLIDAFAGGVPKAVAIAKVAMVRQASDLGVEMVSPSAPLHDRPSEAALAVVRRHGVVPSPEQAESLASLDGLPDPVGGALRDVLDAYLGVEEAANRVMSPLDWSNPAASGLGSLLGAGVDFIDAVARLVEALDVAPVAAPAVNTVSMCPALALDLANADDTYVTDCALVLDLGGDDWYLNNAGGSHLGGPYATCGAINGVAGHVWGAAALVDLGAGSDRYGDYASPKSCGVNGGGVQGSGFLLDDGGGDAYAAGSGGTNGGGFLGVGFLLDVDGHDAYSSGSEGTNGGGHFGAGLLIDLLGTDAYAAGSQGTNGGASLGSGLLLDGRGSDVYEAEGEGTNGGSNADGAGFLLDGGGNDSYQAGAQGTNGGSWAGTGFLWDAGGNDAFSAGGRGSNGGALLGMGFLFDGGGDDAFVASDGPSNGGGGAVAILVDLAGDDRYQAAGRGVNGGGLEGSGFLFDLAGSDVYEGGEGANGGASLGGTGFLLDLSGDDAYGATGVGGNGGGNIGAGFLVDGSGDDSYTAASEGANGGGNTGTGALIDLAGNDKYVAGSSGANGGGSGLGGVGFLLDGAGDDSYDAGSSGTNGGAAGGAGGLVDLAGDDSYQAGNDGTNGGARTGSAFLIDLDGNDDYTAGSGGTNGGGAEAGAGFLLDRRGSDTYSAISGGTNGGAFTEGQGFLMDGGGNDTYLATSSGTNGGSRSASVGFLFDAAGRDVYNAAGGGTNGGTDGGVGFLYDAAGDDHYAAGSVSTNGGGALGSGFLIDQGGDDNYTAGGSETNGGAFGGTGLLLDVAGTDTYTADGAHVNGGGDFGQGLLVDLGGTGDRYNEGPFSCTDCTDTFKGAIVGTEGMQLDQPVTDALPPVGLGLRDHGDGTCSLVADTDGDGTVEPDESLAFPCPLPRLLTHSDGRRTLYVDLDGNGQPGSGEAQVTLPSGDGDVVPDEAEAELCAQQNVNFNFDGTCDGDDYSPATLEGLHGDIETILAG